VPEAWLKLTQHGSGVPTGRFSLSRAPGVKTPGYYQTSLWDALSPTLNAHD